MLIWVDTPTAKVGCWEMTQVENLLRNGGRISHYEVEVNGVRHIGTMDQIKDKISCCDHGMKVTRIERY
jgi:hypothetical protein